MTTSVMRPSCRETHSFQLPQLLPPRLTTQEFEVSLQPGGRASPSNHREGGASLSVLISRLPKNRQVFVFFINGVFYTVVQHGYQHKIETLVRSVLNDSTKYRKFQKEQFQPGRKARLTVEIAETVARRSCAVKFAIQLESFLCSPAGNSYSHLRLLPDRPQLSVRLGSHSNQ